MKDAHVEEGTYQLLVKIGLAAKDNFNDVESLLNRVVPQNMVVTLLQLYNTHAELGRFTHEQNSQAQYDYYKAGNSRVAYNHSAVSTAVWWWLRSPRCSGSTFRDIYTDGGNSNSNANYSAGVRPGFCKYTRSNVVTEGKRLFR